MRQVKKPTTRRRSPAVRLRVNSPAVRLRTYAIIADHLHHAIEAGVFRAYKHAAAADPRESMVGAIIRDVDDAVMTAVSELFEFPEEFC